MTKSTYGKRRIKSGKKKGGFGNNGGFREALRLKPLPPVRQLKGGKGGYEILIPGAYVDGGKVGCIKADMAEAATVCICGVPKPLCGLCVFESS